MAEGVDHIMDTNIQNIPATSTTSRQISSEFQPNFSCLTSKHKRSNEHLGINDPPEKKISYMIPNRIISLANNFYDDSHHGPFEVHIQKVFESNEKDTNSISDIRLAKAFNRAFPQIWSQAYNLRSLGISKFTVTMHEKDSANDFVLKMKDVGDKIFHHSNWTAYIPEYRTHSRVITKDLGSSETPDEILEYLSPLPDQSRNWTAPTFIKCIRRRVNDPSDPSTVSYINTNTFMFTFKGASPPSCALYLGKIVRFAPYIQKIKRCYNCQRFGHLEEQCRGGDRARACCNCASRLHSAENCNSNIVNCINCIRAKYSNSSHASSAFHCPVYIFNRRVKIIMAKLGLSYIDALAYFKKFESRLDDGWFNIDFKRDQSNTLLGDYIPWSNSDHSAFSSSSCDPDWPSLHPSSPRTVRSTGSSDSSLLDSNTNSSARQPRSARRKSELMILLQGHLNLDHATRIEEPNPVEQIMNLYDALDTALVNGGSYVKRHRSMRRRPPAYWWDGDCEALAGRKRIAYQTFKKHPNSVNIANYYSTCKVVKNELRKIKRSKFRNFCSSLNKDSNIQRTWNIIKSFSKKRPNSIISNEFSESKITLAKLTFEKVLPIASTSNLQVPIRRIPTSSPSMGIVSDNTITPSLSHTAVDFLGDEISWEEFITVFNRAVKKKTAPGPDLISYNILSHLPQEVRFFIWRIFNGLFMHGSYPEIWKKFHLIFLPKSISSGLRPISLACNLFKILERIIKQRLEWWIERNNVLPHYQNGFRRGRSCASNVLTLKSYIEQAFTEKNRAGVVFIDIKGAFDNVNIPKLLSFLGDLNLPLPVLNFVSFLLLNREVTGFFAGECLGTRRCSTGVPQGSVLSPLLFNLYISRIHMGIDRDIGILAYADDIAIFCKNKHFYNIVCNLERNLSIIAENLKVLDLSISSNKTKFCIFSKNNRFSTIQKSLHKTNKQLKIYNEVIPLSSNATFLGYTFDFQLSWKQHINNLRYSCLGRLKVLRAIAGIKWGAHPITMLNVYKGFIKSVLVWGGLTLTDIPRGHIVGLDRIQYAAIRTVLGLMKTTPTNVLLDLVAEWPLKYSFNFNAIKSLIKSWTLPGDPLCSLLSNWFCSVCDSGTILDEISSGNTFINFLKVNWLRLKNIPNNRLPGLLNVSFKSQFFTYSIFLNAFDFIAKLKYKVGDFWMGDNGKISAKGINKLVVNHLKKMNLSLVIYSDGSVLDDGSSGFGIFCSSPEIRESIPLRKSYSIFYIEALAILRAIEIIVESGHQNAGICSDSKSVLFSILAMDYHGKHQDIIWLIKDKIYNAHSSNIYISLFWIPGHKDVEGNDTADLLAKLAALSTEPPIMTQDSAGNLVADSQRSLMVAAHLELENQFGFKGIRYRNHLHQLSRIPWFSGLDNLDRSIITLMSRVRSYHVCTGIHLMEKEIICNATCECGISPRDIDHILFKCPITTEQSDKLIINLLRINSFNCNIHEEAFKNNFKLFHQICKFLNDTNQSI